MTKPKRHHWWPRVQQRFWTDSDELIYVTRADGTYFQTSPDNIAVKSELYTRFPDDGSKDTAIEEWFASEIDAPATEMLSFFSELPNPRRFKFSGDEKQAATLRELGFRVRPYVELIRVPGNIRANIARYLAALFVRHPIYLTKLTDFHEANASGYRPRELALDNMLHMYEVYSDAISKAHVSLVRTDGDTEFVYGDGGIVVNEPWRNENGFPFDMHAPLTPDLALEVLPTPFDDDLRMMPVSDLANQGIARFNRISVGGATRFVFSRRRPPVQFIQANFGRPAPKNIGYRIVNGKLETKYDRSRK